MLSPRRSNFSRTIRGVQLRIGSGTPVLSSFANCSAITEPAEIVALRLVALMSLQKRQLFQRFHTLGHHAQLQAAAHADHGRHDGGLIRSSGDLADKGLVNLQRINRKFSQVTQAGISRAEIVHRQLDSAAAQYLHNGLRGLGALHQDDFGKFHLQRRGIEAGVLQNSEYAIQKVLVAEFHRGNVYGHGR